MSNRNSTTAGPRGRGLEAMTSSLQFPPVSAQLVEMLEKLHPLKPPSVDQPDRAIWIEVGRQEIITMLRNRVRTQPASVGALTEVNVSEV